MKRNKKLFRASILCLLGVVMTSSSVWAADGTSAGMPGAAKATATPVTTSVATVPYQSTASRAPITVTSTQQLIDSLAIAGALGPIGPVGTREAVVVGLNKDFSYTYHPHIVVNPHELHSADGQVYALPNGVTVFDVNRVATPRGTVNLMEGVTRDKSIKQVVNDLYDNNVVQQLPLAERASYVRDTADGQAMDIVRDVKFFQLQGHDEAGYRTAYGMEINIGPDAAMALRGVAALVGQEQAVIDEVLAGTVSPDYATKALAELATANGQATQLTPEQLHRLAVASTLLEKQVYGDDILKLQRQERAKEREMLSYIAPFYEIPANTATRKALLEKQLNSETVAQVQELQHEYTALNIQILQETVHSLLTHFQNLKKDSAVTGKQAESTKEALRRLAWLDSQATAFWQRTNLVTSDEIKEAFVADSLQGPGAFAGVTGTAQIDGFTVGLAQVSFMRYTKDGSVITIIAFDPSTYTYWSKALQSMWGLKR